MPRNFDASARCDLKLPLPPGHWCWRPHVSWHSRSRHTGCGRGGHMEPWGRVFAAPAGVARRGGRSSCVATSKTAASRTVASRPVADSCSESGCQCDRGCGASSGWVASAARVASSEPGGCPSCCISTSTVAETGGESGRVAGAAADRGCSRCVGAIVVELGGETSGCNEKTATGSAVAAAESGSEGCPGLR